MLSSLQNLRFVLRNCSVGLSVTKQKQQTAELAKTFCVVKVCRRGSVGKCSVVCVKVLAGHRAGYKSPWDLHGTVQSDLSRLIAQTSSLLCENDQNRKKVI